MKVMSLLFVFLLAPVNEKKKKSASCLYTTIICMKYVGYDGLWKNMDNTFSRKKKTNDNRV